MSGDFKVRVYFPQNQVTDTISMSEQMYYCDSIKRFYDATHNYQGQVPRPFHIMRCTGLKDKNGVDIYAGDIVYFDEYSESCLVVYVKAKYMLKRLDKDRPAYIPEYTELSYRESEIIVTGNIYQNADLLSE